MKLKNTKTLSFEVNNPAHEWADIPVGTIAKQVTGIIDQYEVSTTLLDKKPYHLLRIKGDPRKFIFWGNYFIQLQEGSTVTLHSFCDFKDSYELEDRPDNEHYPEAIELKDEAGKVIVSIRMRLETVFED